MRIGPLIAERRGSARGHRDETARALHVVNPIGDVPKRSGQELIPTLAADLAVRDESGIPQDT